MALRERKPARVTAQVSFITRPDETVINYGGAVTLKAFDYGIKLVAEDWRALLGATAAITWRVYDAKDYCLDGGILRGVDVGGRGWPWETLVPEKYHGLPGSIDRHSNVGWYF